MNNHNDQLHTQDATLRGVLAYFLGHTVVWIGLVYLLGGSSRVSFAYLGDASTPWLRQFILPLLAVLTYQAIVFTKRGWWGSIFQERERTKHRWLWWPVGGFVILSMTGALVIGGWNEAGVGYVLGMGSTVLLVGLTEEFSFRGAILIRARGLFEREWAAALFATSLFGLFHLPNALLGSPLAGELVHVVQTAALGMLFYAMRRLSGSIWLPILVHAVWDFVVLQGNWDIINTLT